MEFTVTVSDFYLDEEDLESGLKRAIRQSVLKEIQQSIKDKVEILITNAIKSEIELSLQTNINNIVKEVINTGEIKKQYGQDKVLIVDYIKDRFTEKDASRGMDNFITTLATKFGDELKKRYDLLFASQIVAKMSEGGLLKEDAIKLLLKEK